MNVPTSDELDRSPTRDLWISFSAHLCYTWALMTTGTTSAALSARRVQYRVGHGGFHATFVNPTRSKKHRLTYVYDVGAKPSKALLRTAISSFVDDLTGYGTTQVDYIVLSHIDEDHVNGLGELLHALKLNHIAVKNVILPWLSPVQRLLTQTRNNHRQPGTTTTRLGGAGADADHYLEQAGVENVIRITAEGEEGQPLSNVSTVQPQGTNVSTSTSALNWTLIPIKTPVPPDFERLFRAELYRLLNRGKTPTGLDPEKTTDHEQILKNHKSKIRSAMTNVASKVGVSPKHITNWSSLALLHGGVPTSTACTLGNPITRHVDTTCTHGWLHTGDLPLKDPVVSGNLVSELSQSPLATLHSHRTASWLRPQSRTRVVRVASPRRSAVHHWAKAHGSHWQRLVRIAHRTIER